jgi:tRNA(His) 5'-end guanylyltransferase
MTTEPLDQRMRELECFHALRVVPGAWPIIRVDGRSFSRLTEKRFAKPFDERFHDLMRQTARALLTELSGAFAYTQSDEISVLLPAPTRLFHREVEKLVSVSAGIASSVFTLALQEAAHFDSRVCVAPSLEQVVEYFKWRQDDATRCCLNGWCYWTLRKEGRSVADAQRELHGKGFAYQNELLFQRGINFNDLPIWQRRGTALYWIEEEISGTNPLTGESTQALRRRVRIDEAIPMGEEYERFVRDLVVAAGAEPAT